MHLNRRRLAFGIALLAMLTLSSSIAIAAGTTERVSVSSTGNEANGVSFLASISASGDFVVFISAATNLVPGDDNGLNDIFVRNLNTNTTEILNLGARAAQDYSDFVREVPPSISSNGQYVAFISMADDLVAGDTNESFDVFVHNRSTGTNERVSVATGGAEGDDWSFDATLSPNGRYVVFTSHATNLVVGDTNDLPDVFVHDRTAGTTERISEGSGGVQADGESYEGSINDDGRYVSFTSNAPNLASETVFEGENVYVHDRTTGDTVLASVRSDGTPGNDESDFSMISGNGRYVVFVSKARNFRDDITIPFPSHVYRHDLTTGVTELVSWRYDDTHGAGSHWDPVVSADGRFVSFAGNFSGLVPDDTNGDFDVFLRDITAGTTERISVSSSGSEGNNHSTSQSISADGRFVVFLSLATNLVPDDTNGPGSDVFIHDRQEQEPAPIVNAGVDTMAVEGETFSRTGVFIDSDSSSWTATVDYDDGAGPQPLDLNPDNTFELSHVFTDPDPFTDIFDVTVEVCDFENNCGFDTFKVRVLETPIVVFAGFDLSVEPGEEMELEPATFDVIDDLDDHIATIDWGDGTPLESGSVNHPTNMVFASHTYSTAGEYTVEVCVSDVAGNNDCDTFTAFVFVPFNNPPIVDFQGAGMYEGDSYALTGVFRDGDSTAWTATVDYGNGDGPQPLPLDDDKSYDLNYTYLEDGSYDITIVICDDGEACGEATNKAVVLNVAPTVDAGSDQVVQPAATVNLPPATFTDPGTLDTHTTTIDWGDGSPIESGTLNQIAMTVSGSHSYTATGEYTVDVCVKDDDEGEGCDSFVVTVTDQPVNQPPSVNAGGDIATIEGAQFIRNGVFTDPDSSTWTATVDYSDGPGPADLTLTGMGFTIDQTDADDTSYTVTVCVTDEGNATGCDEFLVTISNALPVVDAGDDRTAETSDIITLSPATFTDPGVADTHTATIDWGDGSALESGFVDQAAGTVSGSHSYTTAGTYTVEVCVTDDDAGEGCDSFLITVTDTPVNAAPGVNAGSDGAIDEGDTFTSSGAFTDPDSSSWTATVDYGDGGGIANLPLSGMSFSLSHTYLDDGSYTLEVCVTDEGNETGCDTLIVTVTNVAPAVSAGPDQTAGSNSTVSLGSVTFSDPGDLDSHTATIDWGDGSPIDTGTVNQTANTVSGSHSYTSAGQFNATVCVSDDSDAEQCDGFLVTIQEVSMEAIELCANQYNGVIRMPERDCAAHEIVVSMPDDLPLTFCVSRYTGLLRYLERGSCSWSEWQLDFPDDGPINVCVSQYTDLARYSPTASGCRSYERHYVLGGVAAPESRDTRAASLGMNPGGPS